MAIVLHEEKQNRKTLSTVTPTTFGAAQTQLPCSSVRKVNINVSDTSVCVLEAAAGSVVPPKPAPASICVHSVCVWGGGCLPLHIHLHKVKCGNGHNISQSGIQTKNLTNI